MEDFSAAILVARDFLKKLKANNTRDWFLDHKKEYENAVKKPGTRIGEEIADRLSELTGHKARHKLFRVNRDVRFSKDKTPYNTHMHLLWDDGSGPGFFLGVSPEYITAGCGVMGLQKERLDRYRAKVDKHGDTIAADIKALITKGYRLDDPDLKRVPSPYDKNHIHGDLLKRKSLALWFDFEGEMLSTDLLIDRFSELMPIYRFLQGTG